MKKSIPVLAAAFLMTAIATPVFAQAAIQEPGAYSFYHPTCLPAGKVIGLTISRMPITTPTPISTRSRRRAISQSRRVAIAGRDNKCCAGAGP